MMMQPVASPMRIAAPARLTAALMLLASLGACTALPAAPRAMPPADEVRVREQAFARTMADRDFEAFATFVADDAVFLNGGRPLRGKAAVLAHWQRFFDTADAPFSWTPDLVEALPNGLLAHSEGPVSAPDGRVIARFYSTWRRGTDGVWRVVFDNGHDVCPPP
ncbi:MAG: nuclear transport factor 2 family protein [Pseudomonadota bacterium]|nr:nuclear transport factor 2 family protein [Pseudomonadota bacterium]